jgi:hypothetical protein
MRIIRTLALLLGVTACGGSTSSPPEGPLKLGIVAGNNQVAPAGSAKLTDPVVGRLVRVSTASGPRFEFVKTAYAQTVVTGSPVPGAVVCAVSVTAGSMVPFVPCTNTDADGKATFFFTPGTKAGEAESEIRGTLAGQPAVFDTAKATVLPGPAAEIALVPWPNCSPACPPKYPIGGTLDLHTVIKYVRDQYQNLIVPATTAEISDAGVTQNTTAITPQWAIRDGSEPGQPAPDASGWIVTFPKAGRFFVYIWVGSARASVDVDVQ